MRIAQKVGPELVCGHVEGGNSLKSCSSKKVRLFSDMKTTKILFILKYDHLRFGKIYVSKQLDEFLNWQFDDSIEE